MTNKGGKGIEKNSEETYVGHIKLDSWIRIEELATTMAFTSFG